MKTFLIICVLLATTVFSSLSTSTARELSHQGPDRTLDDISSHLVTPVKPPRGPIEPPHDPVKPPRGPIEPPHDPRKPPRGPIEPPHDPRKPPRGPIEPPHDSMKPPRGPMKPKPPRGRKPPPGSQ
ncbi:hypothetical protein OIU74_027723 [Salix koriyanagi]|uniref:Proline-rich protein n=1 Tax=Salix koriyanagi TaxID=2511006 RepID=A0A9Q0VSV2_9ROSI|nr:hypothetical protein OIU74_027723 [Salix koriyanagi]